MSGYNYVGRHVAPQTVEFTVRTAQGFRVVRFLGVGSGDPSVMAFNESNFQRTPAILYLSELDDLLSRARLLISSS